MFQHSHAAPQLLNYVINHPSLPIEFMLVLFLTWRWVTVPRDKERVEYLLGLCLIVSPVCYVLLRRVLAKLTSLCPLKYDLYAYQFGTWFGCPSFELRRFALNHHWFFLLTKLTYDFVFLSIVGTVAAYLWLGSKQQTHIVLKTFGLNILIAPLVYILIPIAGPLYAFPGFPLHPAEVIPQPILIAAAPKGIPSLHMSMALIAFWFLCRWRWGRILGGIYVALMVVAVLATGEHYLLDVICSLPYTAVILYLGTPKHQPAEHHRTLEEIHGLIAWRGDVGQSD